MTKAKDIDEYIKNAPSDSRVMLKQIRAIVKKIAPSAEEAISYSIAAFKLDKKILIYFAGWKDHVSLYPVPKGNPTMQKQISKYRTGKGTLWFPLDKPLPVNFITQIVKLRVKENHERIKSKRK